VSFEEAVSYLHKAKNHFEDGLNNTGKEAINYSTSKDLSETAPEEKFDAVMSDKDALRYLRTVKLQIDICNAMAKEQKFKEENPPTLFGSSKKRLEICVKLMLVDQFDLAFRIIQEYRLSAVECYVHSVRSMARQRQVNRLSELFRNIKATISDDEWDHVLEVCISVFCKELQDIKLAEKFMPMIIGDANKITAFIISGKLRNAYLHAVKVHRYSDIEKIKQEAVRTNQTAVVQLCDKFLTTKQE